MLCLIDHALKRVSIYFRLEVEGELDRLREMFVGLQWQEGQLPIEWKRNEIFIFCSDHKKELNMERQNILYNN